VKELHEFTQCPFIVPGVVNNYRGKLVALKSETSALILRELSKFFIYIPHWMLTYYPGAVTHVNAKMYYQNFDSHITRTHRVVIQGWPLPKFCCPSDIGSLTEVQLLYDSWKSQSTTFRKLTDVEWKKWLDNDFAERMDGEQQQSDEEEEEARADAVTTAQQDAAAAAVNSGEGVSERSGEGTAAGHNGMYVCIGYFNHIVDVLFTGSNTPGEINLVSQPSAPPAKRRSKTATDSRSAKRRKAAPLTDFVNTITSSDGQQVITEKKARKARSDKGKPRGPRKKVTATSTAPPATSMSPPATSTSPPATSANTAAGANTVSEA
jgi:hypothetical protein